MKKYLSFILAICILFGCVSLISCNFEGIFGKTSSSSESTEPDATTKPSEQSTQPTQPTEPTSSSSSVTEPEPEELVFEHGDNFTEEDIEFVKSLQGEYKGPSGTHNIYSFTKMINGAQTGTPIYHVNIDIDNPYFICAYVSTADSYEINTVILDVSQYTWYKFYNLDDIPTSIDNNKLMWKYLLYNCTIKRDIVNNIEYDYHCIYYYPMKRDLLLDKWNENILIQYPSRLPITEITKYLLHENSYYFSLPVYVDENGVPYLYFTYTFSYVENGEEKIVHFSNAQEMLGEFYDTLYPYACLIEELGFEGIELRLLSQILFTEGYE